MVTPSRTFSAAILVLLNAFVRNVTGLLTPQLSIVRILQFKNADAPILVSFEPAGKVNDVMLLQLANASEPIVFSDVGKTISPVRLVQLENAP